ncbi:pentatricopeptide repeat-containing protein [Carex littledalei]|uniref:Pentatricopeptide repeat-containing protein n=1 Tax=Carex littledalei TaxID=544730 RepID=A0A833QFS4_9POAL|nr:pentatricopeptide repeat-containing protein [Carex littledalei]
MAAKSALLRSHAFLPKLLPSSHLRLISTFPHLSQEPQLEPSPPPSSPTPLPPNPSTGSPFYNENWRNPQPTAAAAASLLPVPGQSVVAAGMIAFSQTMDLSGLLNLFADYMASQRWNDIQSVFEYWVRSLDGVGKPNKPDVNLFNHYLRARLMLGADSALLLDLVQQMQEFDVKPNAASYNLVFESMVEELESINRQQNETGDSQEDRKTALITATTQLFDKMLAEGPLPDDRSFNLVVGLLIRSKHFDTSLTYLDLMLKSGKTLNRSIYNGCIQFLLIFNKPDAATSFIDKCKASAANKNLVPTWNLCHHIADVAFKSESSKLAYQSLEFFARWIEHGEKERPQVLLSVEEGLSLAALGTASRTYDSKLLDGSWQILKRSLRQKKVPNPETYLMKINAHASLGQVKKAFETLNELEMAYGDAESTDPELFSPFTSLNPLVIACSRNGFSSLDAVYLELEKWCQAEKPYKSIAALNCVLLGCANIWDLDRAYETFQALEKIGVTPNIHSYNALLYAFGKHQKTTEACDVFEHLVSIGVKPNATTYSLIVDAHLINRDPTSALKVINEMVEAGFVPTKQMLKKIRRRCSRQMDYDSDDKVQNLARDFKIRMGNEIRREMLFNLEYSTQY